MLVGSLVGSFAVHKDGVYFCRKVSLIIWPLEDDFSFLGLLSYYMFQTLTSRSHHKRTGVMQAGAWDYFYKTCSRHLSHGAILRRQGFM